MRKFRPKKTLRAIETLRAIYLEIIESKSLYIAYLRLEILWFCHQQQ